jgi:hypothetical protein
MVVSLSPRDLMLRLLAGVLGFILGISSQFVWLVSTRFFNCVSNVFLYYQD